MSISSHWHFTRTYPCGRMTTILRKPGSSGTPPLNCYRSWEGFRTDTAYATEVRTQQEVYSRAEANFGKRNYCQGSSYDSGFLSGRVPEPYGHYFAMVFSLKQS